MILKCLFITRNADHAVPELLLAWDEYSIEENEEMYLRYMRREIQAVDGDCLAHQIIDVEVDEQAIIQILLSNAKITGTITPGE